MQETKHNRVLDFLGIGKLGFFEIVFALYLILAGYNYGSFRLDFYTLLFLDIFALCKGYKFDWTPKILYYLVLYVIIHEIVLYLVFTNQPSYLLNSIFAYIVTLLSIFIIFKTLKEEEFKSALYLIGIISSIGLFFHFYQLMSGQLVVPIRLPFMPEPAQTSRFFEEGLRPKSFFGEPEACITYLLVPLYLSLKERKFHLSFFFFFSIFLSTSTTGILLSSVSIFVYSLTQKSKWYIRALCIVMIIAMVYVLLNGEVFSGGLEKIQNTNAEENNRLVAGPNFVKQMPLSYWFVGIPFANAFDCAIATHMNADGLYIDSHNELFVSTFWNVIIKLGIVGISFYLLMYRYFLKKSRTLWPYIIPCMVGMFAQGSFFGAVFIFQTVFILFEINHNRQEKV